MECGYVFLKATEMWIIEKSINPTLKRKRIDTKIYTTYHRKNMKQRQ